MDTSYVREAVYPHLITTKWDQKPPWNQCAPYTKDYSNRCAAGCVPVAAAQMLYFLNQKWGIPEKWFTEGTCVGYANGSGDKNFYFSFNSPSTTVWSNIGVNLNASSYSIGQTAILIGSLGHLLGADYSEKATNAKTEKVRNLFADHMGISSTYSDFNSSTVINSLRRGIPVIVRADGGKNTYLFGLFSIYADGHSWIIDGYKTTTRTTILRYRWISTDTEVDIYERDDDGNIVEYYEKTMTSTTESHLFLMNWGWCSPHDNGFYSMGGDWIIGDGSGEAFNFKYRRKMLHNFSPI